MKTKIISLLLLIFMLTGVVMGAVSCTVPDNGDSTDKETPDENKDNVVDAVASSFVSLDINPEITLTLNDEGIVLTVVGENEDAQVLLYGEETLVGLSVDEAVEKIVSLATELGYMTEDNKAVELLASSKTEEATQALLNNIKASITATAQASGLNVTVDTEGAYSLVREYEAFIAEHPELAESVNISKYKMALTAAEDGKITVDAAVALDDQALIDRISNAHKEIENYYTDIYEERRAEAMRIYELALETEVDKVYAEYFAANGKSASVEMLYAYIYQVYAITARGLFAAADTMDFFDTAKNYELDDERVSEIAAALGLSENETDKLKDADGKITLDSVLDYTDIYMKNTDMGVDKEAIKAAIDESIASAEADVIEEADRLAAEYKPQIKAVLDSSDLIKTTYDAAMGMIAPFLPEAMRTELGAMMEDYEAAITLLGEIMSDGAPTAEEIRTVAIDLQTAADETLIKIESRLDEAAKADIEARKQAKRDARAAERLAFEETISAARADAEARLAALKAERENNSEEN